MKEKKIGWIIAALFLGGMLFYAGCVLLPQMRYGEEPGEESQTVEPVPGDPVRQ